jgi:hemerythrin-like domain-containing protein
MGTERRQTTRRDFVLTAAGTGAGLLLAGCGASPPARRQIPKQVSAPEEAVRPAGESPGEDLMREHGLLGRVLLVYEEGLRRLERERTVVDALAGGARVVRRFVQDYHERLEEKHVFPRFEKAGRWVQLVATLRQQHEAGRWLTDEALRLATRAHMRGVGNRRRLAESLRLFIRMYRPHAAREDTVLLPAFRRLVGRYEYEELGRAFEQEERTVLGEQGFDRTVEEVASLERALGIHDLARFTPG